MLRFHKTLDVITLFHKPSIAASTKVQSILKKAVTASEDSQSSDTNKKQRDNFELDITETPPTSDQLRNILEYIGGPSKAGTLVKGAVSEADVLKKVRESADNLRWPITVDWNNGRAVVGDQQSEILKMVQSLPKDQ